MSIHTYVCIYIYFLKVKNKIIRNKVNLELTGTMEMAGAAATFPVNSTVNLAVEIQRHAVITNFF